MLKGLRNCAQPVAQRALPDGALQSSFAVLVSPRFGLGQRRVYLPAAFLKASLIRSCQPDPSS